MRLNVKQPVIDYEGRPLLASAINAPKGLDGPTELSRRDRCRARASRWDRRPPKSRNPAHPAHPAHPADEPCPAGPARPRGCGSRVDRSRVVRGGSVVQWHDPAPGPKGPGHPPPATGGLVIRR